MSGGQEQRGPLVVVGGPASALGSTHSIQARLLLGAGDRLACLCRCRPGTDGESQGVGGGGGGACHERAAGNAECIAQAGKAERQAGARTPPPPAPSTRRNSRGPGPARAPTDKIKGMGAWSSPLSQGKQQSKVIQSTIIHPAEPCRRPSVALACKREPPACRCVATSMDAPLCVFCVVRSYGLLLYTCNRLSTRPPSSMVLTGSSARAS